METKRISSKEVITYLVEKFPECFSIKGAVKPLKIGIFQDLSVALVDDETVSKTRLRQALRHYTSSWRYLKSIKAGVFRIDLEGKDAEEIDEPQAEYARKTLKESQDKFAHQKSTERNDAKKQDASKNHQNKTNTKKATDSVDSEKRQAKFKSVKSTAARTQSKDKKPVKPLKAVESSTISVNQKVKVQLGHSPMNATITEISGKDISVQLDSGMVIKTTIQNIYSE